jgi:DNA invertase Pin-like site-specific DNA recombinase
MASIVPYYRVSTEKQGGTGLGMDAQKALIARYTESTNATVLQEFQEVETGKGNGLDRPELVKAIAFAKRHKAKLVIGKLDRLGRNVHFISGLMESGVDFVAADSPGDDRFILHIKAAVAEDEARKISDRTKAALAALKARGVTLGTPRNLTDDARTKGAARNRAMASTAYALMLPLVKQLRSEKLSYEAIAQRLNEGGHSTRQGFAWTKVQVRRVLSRIN